MTTWTRDEAINVRSNLHDANFFLSLARVAIQRRDYRLAWQHVGSAMAAKHQALYECPEVDSDTDRDPVGFDEIYLLFEKMYLVMLATVVKLDHVGIESREGQSRELKRSADEIEAFGDTHWPAPNPCNDRWKGLAGAVRAYVDALNAAGDLSSANVSVRDAMEAVLDCVYPDMEPDMFEVYWYFFWMDEGLLDAYVILKDLIPIYFTGKALADKALFHIGWAEERKNDLIDLIEGAFDELPEPAVPDWDPAPDALPWPPEGHV
jgi:hypothetical protein